MGLDRADRHTLISHYPILSQLPESIRDDALAQARVVNLDAGTPVFNASDACLAFPFVLEGLLRVFKTGADGRELTLYRVGPGDACLVSTGCLLGKGNYQASAMVLEACRVVMLPDSAFDALMALPPFRTFIFSLFSQRVIHLMQLVEEVAFQRLDRRLATLLIGQGPVGLASHQALAQELGTVREMVSRLLSGFRDSGWVSLSRGRIEILDTGALERISE
ncbi:MAG: Crp/Fnr family transcriptional regulator [Desulfobacterales bacterium]|nr:Crp/Fnr family transcriptional regulator [Desulfobacterales bacterium]